jgi:hypothetical protein
MAAFFFHQHTCLRYDEYKKKSSLIIISRESCEVKKINVQNPFQKIPLILWIDGLKYPNFITLNKMAVLNPVATGLRTWPII